MTKKILFFLTLSVLFGFVLTERTRAMTMPILYPFSPVKSDPLFASAGGGIDCQGTSMDTAYYQYELVVTEQLLTELETALDVGEQPMPWLIFDILDSVNPGRHRLPLGKGLQV